MKNIVFLFSEKFVSLFPFGVIPWSGESVHSVNSGCSTCTYSANFAYVKATQMISAPLFVDLLPFNKAFDASPV